MNSHISRRDALHLGAAGMISPGGLGLSEPLVNQMDAQRSGKSSGMSITNVDCFMVKVPWDEEEIKAGKMNQYGAVRITTTDGITGCALGYGFGWLKDRGEERDKIRRMLIGQDPCAIERFLGLGLGKYALIEHALWDVIGKAAGMPVHKLLGGNKKKTKFYLTMVWPGKADQSHMTAEQQGEDILRYNRLGYQAVKIRAQRPTVMDDVEVAKYVMQRATPGFRLMFDRTAEMSGWTWTYEQGLDVALGLQEAGAYWLEEPFEVGDMIKSAKLTQASDMLITGGEHDYDIYPFAKYLANDVFDIVQPDGFTAGGILTIKKIGTIAQSFNKPCIMHGTHSLCMFAWLQINASLVNCEYQEIGLIRPPILPFEQWEPGVRLLNTPDMFEMDKEYLTIPQGPGLGADINEDALREYRV